MLLLSEDILDHLSVIFVEDHQLTILRRQLIEPQEGPSPYSTEGVIGRQLFTDIFLHLALF